MRTTLLLTLLLTACGASPTDPRDASYPDVDDFKPHDAGSTGGGSGGGSGGASALFSSDGRYATPPTPLKIFCGPMPCDAGSSVCCLDNPGSPVCGAPAAACGGNVTFACDGPEDCGSGQLCCLEPTEVDGGATRVATVCRATCSMGPTQMCHSASECPSEKPYCCSGPTFPLGHCLPGAATAAGDTCDAR